MHILFVVQYETNGMFRQLRAFNGMQRTVLARTADFVGVSGASLANVREATVILEG